MGRHILKVVRAGETEETYYSGIKCFVDKELEGSDNNEEEKKRLNRKIRNDLHREKIFSENGITITKHKYITP